VAATGLGSAVTEIVGGSGVLVRSKVAAVDAPLVVAVVVQVPAVALAVAVTEASPDEFVSAELAESVPLTPLEPGTGENETAIPAGAADPSQVTVATSGFVNAVEISADCPEPDVAAIVTGEAQVGGVTVMSYGVPAVLKPFVVSVIDGVTCQVPGARDSEKAGSVVDVVPDPVGKVPPRSPLAVGAVQVAWSADEQGVVSELEV